MHYKHSFGIIVHNGSSFVRHAIESIYAVAHEIIVIEGCEPPAQFMAQWNGLSVDDTAEVVRCTADPDKKIRFIQGGKYPSKNDQCNVYMKMCTGDYIWELDSDELYHAKDVIAVDELLFQGKYEAVEVPFLHFWRDTFHIARQTSWEIPIRRIFKFQRGDVYATHRPPEISRKKWSAMKLLAADILRAKGIFCYHYGFVDNQRTKWKVAYHCNRGCKFEPDFDRHWIGNTGRHYNNMDEPINTIEEFKGILPATILNSRWGRKTKVRVLHVLPYWSNGGGCTCVRDLIYASNLGYYNHGLYIDQANYKGVSPLLPTIPFYSTDFEYVAAQYDVVEIMFWKSMPELTKLLKMKRRPKIVVIIPIYNDNSLKGSYDRFYLTDEEKRQVDHVVFMTDKALALPENKGITNKSVVPWGPELIWAAREGYHWRANTRPLVGYVGPVNPAVTHPRLPEILAGVSRSAIIEMVGEGSLRDDFKRRVPKDQTYRWLGHLGKADFWSAIGRWDVYTYPMKPMCYCGSEMKIQEAAAAFCPIVIKPSIGLCEMGLANCGVVCNSDEQVATSINMILQDTAIKQQLQHKARVHALSKLGAHSSTARMEQLYDSLV